MPACGAAAKSWRVRPSRALSGEHRGDGCAPGHSCQAIATRIREDRSDFPRLSGLVSLTPDAYVCTAKRPAGREDASASSTTAPIAGVARLCGRHPARMSRPLGLRHL
jgi:hypothetical protein